MKRTIFAAIQKIAVCLALTLALTSCPNPFEPPKLPKGAAGGEGTFSLRIGGLYAGRTILPATVQSDFAAYTLVFQAEGKTDITVERDNATLSQAITLAAGTWDLTVTAYMDSGKTKPAAQGSLAGITISSGDTISRNIELRAIIQAGTSGTFRWNIQYPYEVVSASMTITPLDAETGTPEQTLYFIGGTPLVNRENTWSPLNLNSGYYRVVFSLSNGKHNTGREEYLHIYQNMESHFEYAFTQDHFTVYSVSSGEDDGPGTLRHAIANAVANSTILVEDGVGTIRLKSRLTIEKSLTIRGNGVTLTRDAAWTGNSSTSQLIYVNNSSGHVNVSRVHFKAGGAGIPGALDNQTGTVNIESCIFSGNHNSSPTGAYGYGGAIRNYGTMSVKACTFYQNREGAPGSAIYNPGILTLTGNLFYGNAYIPVSIDFTTYTPKGSIVSNGYNVVDEPLGTAAGGSGWTPAAGDLSIDSLPLSPKTFKVASTGGAFNLITALPAGYPSVDFYGAAISAPASAGAVQSSVNGYYFELSVNNSIRGSVEPSSALDEENGFIPGGTVTITATPKGDAVLSYWLINGAKAGSANPLTLNIADHTTTVKAVFERVVPVTTLSDAAGSETTPGTLRHALSNATDGDIIRFTNITPNVSTVELTGRLPVIESDITIEGNGVILTRSAAWTTVNDLSQLLLILPDSTVNISRVHFKDGRAADYGAAIRSEGKLNLESCIFSGNRTMNNDAWGGAIYGNRNSALNVSGCTFYGNNAPYQGGAIYGYGMALTGNLFYGNTASTYPVVNGAVSNGYNVVDVALGTGTTESGWYGDASDRTINIVPVSSKSFKLLPGNGAANVIATLPAGYPTADFYGNPITNGAAAGAVQSTVSGSGYYLELAVNSALRGSLNASPAPDADGFVTGSATLTASPQTGYIFGYWLVNGVKAGNANPLTISLTGHTRVQAVFGVELTNFSDAAGSGTTPGTLRYAITNALTDDYIRFGGVTPGLTTIELEGRLEIFRNIVIEGNGVTLTRSASWTTVDDNSQLLSIEGGTINISRVHFKDARTKGSFLSSVRGGAVNNEAGNLTLESCIFSGNQASYAALSGRGGAIFNNGTMNVKGCTFYNNSAVAWGGAIYNTHTASLTLTGNLFYGNTATDHPVVYYQWASLTIISNGYNVVDVPLGTEDNQSGWAAAAGDKTVNTLPLSPKTFKLIPGGGAANVITTLPADYPAVDFYGNPITNGAAAGAVQSAVSGSGFYFELTVNSALRGNASASSTPDADGLISGTVTITANPQAGYIFGCWLVNGVKAGNANPLTMNLTALTRVQAVFGVEITDMSDTAGFGIEPTPGTLRYAVNNAIDTDYIRLGGVTPGLTTIELRDRLLISKSLTIEGNGVTLTRSASWTTVNEYSQLLFIFDHDVAGGITANISRIHFKNGRATMNGAAVHNENQIVNLESCIFSGNSGGGAIFSGISYANVFSIPMSMSVKGCTFYNNSTAGRGGAIYDNGGNSTLTLTGNLFYGNTASDSYPVVYRWGTSSSSNNVVDVPLGTGSTQSGWTAAAGDKTISSLPLSPKTFRPIAGGGAVNVIAALPAGYPTVDFYGNPITNGAAAGAVQSTANSGHYLELTMNNSSRGSVSASPAPDADGMVSGTATLTANPQAGYALMYWLVNGVNTGNANPLSLNLTGDSTIVQAVFGAVFTVTNFSDAGGSATTPGTLRYALTNADNNDIIRLSGVTPGVTTIELSGMLPIISKSLTIEGNGVTLTPNAVNAIFRLLEVYNSGAGITVTISRIHFKDGESPSSSGAAPVHNGLAIMNLESCIFSGNRATVGGAVSNNGQMNLNGCTFYNNSAAYGRAIYNTSNTATLNLTGNLFYRNTASTAHPVVYPSSGTVTSGGYNVVDVPMGIDSTQSGWAAAAGDKTISAVPVSLSSFKLLSGSGAANVITTLPAGYPTVDFYGNAITAGAAAGAVQGAVSGGGYYLELLANNSALGSLSTSPAPDADGLVSAATAITANPQSGYSLLYWLVNGVKTGGANPLNLTLTGHTTVRAVFGRTVSSFEDTTSPGTLRHALTNAQDGDIIQVNGVTPGTSVIELTSALPQISKSVTIEGNGVTLTRSASWTAVNETSQLLCIYSSAATTVSVNRVHFKDGRVTANGAAVYNNGETVNLESCVFSGNQNGSGSGGAIYTSGSMSIKGCTFYNNSAAYGGVIYKTGTLTLTGNLFYGNTASNAYPAAHPGGGTVTSGSYNVVDVDMGTGTAQSGWTAAAGDATFTSLGISGLPFNAATFAPVTGLGTVINSAPADFPAVDFYGNTRTWPGAPGAVKNQ